MPWKETCPVEEKLKFITAWKSDVFTMTELCDRFGVSRKTGYKWLARYVAGGLADLEEHSRAPHHHPNAVSAALVSELLRMKQRYPSWGPKKVRRWLLERRGGVLWPAVSTIGELYQRHGLCQRRGGRQRKVPQTQPLRHCHGPNEVWSADFKGQFRLGDGRWCYPLTIMDSHSRYLLACSGLQHPTEHGTRQGFEGVFKSYGLPIAIRTDNGSPFASVALGGLTRLTIWWIKLGIQLERIDPGHPEQNGRHERMHRTLKAATAKPPKGTLKAQQRAFHQFRREYNEERPHEALGERAPAQVYEAPIRRYPSVISAVEYDADYVVRRVRHNGVIKWRGQQVYVSEALRGEPVGLLPIDNDRWQMYFAQVILGILDERLNKIERSD